MQKIKHIPVIGEKFGQWTVISDEIKRHSAQHNRTRYFKVRCKCGREGWRAIHTLKTGTTKSCKSCSKSPNNIDAFLLTYFNKIKGRAVKSNFEFNLTVEFIRDLLITQNNKCALSDLNIELKPNYKIKEKTASLDRIDNNKGYIIDNVQWVHKDINFMKGKLEQKSFINYCKLINSKCG